MKRILVVTGVFLIIMCAVVLVTWAQHDYQASGPTWNALFSWPEGMTGRAIIATLIVIGWQSYWNARRFLYQFECEKLERKEP